MIWWKFRTVLVITYDDQESDQRCTGRGLTVEGRLPDPGDALTGVDMFSGLEPDVRQRVIQAAVPRTYRKGQLLFVENDPGESLIVLKRGAVMVFRTAPTGERAVLSVVRPPDTLGEVSLLVDGLGA